MKKVIVSQNIMVLLSFIFGWGEGWIQIMFSTVWDSIFSLLNFTERHVHIM